ncbi:RHS repeat-associated core domain-containing protein [Pseudomonas sp. RL_105y_Pfl2_101]|uniref:RHS repeat-associated core domain-containing protein n=1 Tax=Pseudomonas sp. RL_105y_Pfl2_101 TaxID=3088708 RepID=UPI00403FBB2F
MAKEQRSETAKRADLRNPLRFQGQYFDVETGLHYNRYRYYDPQVGRFIGKDPIGFAGGSTSMRTRRTPQIGQILWALQDLAWTCPYQTGHQLPVKLMLPPSA